MILDFLCYKYLKSLVGRYHYGKCVGYVGHFVYTTKIDLSNFHWADGGWVSGACYEPCLFCNLSWRSDV